MADSPYRPGAPPPGPRWGLILGIGAVVLALILVPIIVSAANNSSPKDWLEDHYTAQGGDEDSAAGLRFASDDSVEQTVAAIVSGTNPSEKRQEGASHFLRYQSDWLVEVKDDLAGPGTEIVLHEFDAGYRAHGTTLFFWGSHYQRSGGSFRGGGSGSGK